MPSKFRISPLLEEHERDDIITSVSAQVIEIFKKPESLPDKLSAILIESGGKWSARWSWRNQLIMMAHGHSDAMTYYNWMKQAGRRPRPELMAQHKEKGYVPGGFYILQPLKRKMWVTRTDEDTGEKRNVQIQFTYAYRPHYVFGEEETIVVDEHQWEEYVSRTDKATEKIKDIPFINVALAWGIRVIPANTAASGALGWYNSQQQVIALGVENLSTGCHELVHAAEDRNGNLVKQPGQVPSNEIVAEFGGAVLLRILGMDYDADLGGAYDYVKHYAKEECQGDVVKAVDRVLWRVKAALGLIFQEARNLDEIEVSA